jgi:hypothetical protein
MRVLVREGVRLVIVLTVMLSPWLWGNLMEIIF